MTLVPGVLETTTWLWVAAALLVAPRGSRRIERGRGPAGGAGGDDGTREVGPAGGLGPARGRGSVGNVGPARRLRGGPALAAVLAAVACVVTAGPRVGLVAALVLAPVAGLGVRAAGRRPGRLRTDRSIALPLDLAAAVLRSGRPLADALALAAPAAGPDSAPLLLRVAGLVRLGAGAEDAWSVVPDAHPLRPLAASAVRSAASGIKVADAFERHAAEIRAEAVSAATARAQRAGITAMAPLAACFLPSFVCLGVVPIVVGMATHALGVLG